MDNSIIKNLHSRSFFGRKTKKSAPFQGETWKGACYYSPSELLADWMPK